MRHVFVMWTSVFPLQMVCWAGIIDVRIHSIVIGLEGWMVVTTRSCQVHFTLAWKGLRVGGGGGLCVRQDQNNDSVTDKVAEFRS